MTAVITTVLAVEPNEDIPQTSNIPKPLWIRASTTAGPLALQISETTARELMGVLQNYERVRGFR